MSADADQSAYIRTVGCDGFTVTVMADCHAIRDRVRHIAALVESGGKRVRDLGVAAVDLSNARSNYMVAADDDSACLVGIDLPPSEDAVAYMRAALEAVP